MPDNFVKTNLLYVFKRACKTNCPGRIYRSRLEFMRKFCPCCTFARYIFNHFSAAQKRRHFFKQFFLSVKNANPHRPANFVSAERIKIRADVLYVHLKMRNCLRTVNNADCTNGVSAGSNFLYRISYSKNVAYVSYGNKFCPGVYFIKFSFRKFCRLCITFHKHKLCAFCLRKHLPWKNV